MNNKSKFYPKKKRGTYIALTATIATSIIYLSALYGCNQLQPSNNGNQYTGTTLTHHVDDLDMARTPKGTPSQIIRHTGHTLSYNNQWKIANWVGYELTAQETNGDVERSDWFDPDPQVLGYKVEHSDYTHSGFDRGHLAPAGDMKWNEDAMIESFYMTNICPQVHALNAGLWNNLEGKARNWARRDSAIIIVSGPIVTPDYMTISRNNIAVPAAFFKAIISPYTHSPRGIAFVIPNEDTDLPLHKYALTIDSLETITGIDLFYNLPDSLENYIEQNINLKLWQL